MHLCLTSERSFSFLSFFLLFFASIKISNMCFIVKGNGNQFEDIQVFIKSVKVFDCRFLFIIVLYSIVQRLHSASTPHFVCRNLKSLLECRYLTYLPVYSHSKVWIHNIPHKFHLLLLYSHLKINVLLQQITGYFVFIFCMIIPKKGIFYWDTSTSFVINCANEHVQNLNCQCTHGVSYPCICVNTKCFMVKGKKKDDTRELRNVFKSAFYVGCCAGATKQPFVGTLNPICIKKRNTKRKQWMAASICTSRPTVEPPAPELEESAEMLKHRLRHEIITAFQGCTLVRSYVRSLFQYR